MAKSRKELRTQLKEIYTKKVIDLLSKNGEEVLQVKDCEIALPVVDEEGNEDFIKITIAIPTGAAKGTEPYDGYLLAEDYNFKKKEKEEKKKKALEAKKKKIAKDEAYRKKKEENEKKRKELKEEI